MENIERWSNSNLRWHQIKVKYRFIIQKNLLKLVWIIVNILDQKLICLSCLPWLIQAFLQRIHRKATIYSWRCYSERIFIISYSKTVWFLMQRCKICCCFEGQLRVCGRERSFATFVTSSIFELQYNLPFNKIYFPIIKKLKLFPFGQSVWIQFQSNWLSIIVFIKRCILKLFVVYIRMVSIL